MQAGGYRSRGRQRWPLRRCRTNPRRRPGSMLAAAVAGWVQWVSTFDDDGLDQLREELAGSCWRRCAMSCAHVSARSSALGRSGRCGRRPLEVGAYAGEFLEGDRESRRHADVARSCQERSAAALEPPSVTWFDPGCALRRRSARRTSSCRCRRRSTKRRDRRCCWLDRGVLADVGAWVSDTWRGPFGSPPSVPVAGTPSTQMLAVGAVRFDLSKVWTTRSPYSPS